MNKQICLNKSVLDFMEDRLTPESFVLEFGSGWSSRWFADRCGKLVTVETDPMWATTIKLDLQDSDCDWELRMFFDAPIEVLKGVDDVDLILIDGHKKLRYQFMISSWSRLKPGGWLIFDDAQRPEHKKAIEWLFKWVHGCTRLEWQEGDVPAAKDRITLAWRK